MKNHIIDEGIEEGDPIFGTKDGRYLKNFSQTLTGAFKKPTAKMISVDILRHSYISDFLSKSRSDKEKNDVATRMGHSEKLQSRYRRLDIE